MKAKLIEKEKGNVKAAFVETKKKKALVKMCSVIAEAETTDNGEKVYITCEWMDQNPDEIYFEVLTDSIYDFLTYTRDDIEVLDELQENLIEEYYTKAEALDGRFSEICEALLAEVTALIEEQGLEAEPELW